MLPQHSEKIRKASLYLAVRGLYHAAARTERITVAPSPMKTAHVGKDGAVVFDPSFIDSLDVAAMAFVAAHEHYHVVFQHPRRGNISGRNHMLYNVAADLFVNERLINLGLPRPSGDSFGIFRDNLLFDGMPVECDTSEKVYKWLLDNNKSSDSAMGDIPDSVDNEDDDAELRMEAMQELGANGRAAGEAHDALNIVSQPSRDGWMPLLTAMAIEAGRLVHYTRIRNFQRPSRRPEIAGQILPNWRGQQSCPKVDVYIDISGSMGDMPKDIYSGLRGILKHASIYRPSFYAFNTSIVKVDIKANSLPLGGGTDIKNVMSQIKATKPDLAIIVSDCEDSVGRADMQGVVVVSNNSGFADYITNDFKTVRKVRK